MRRMYCNRYRPIKTIKASKHSPMRLSTIKCRGTADTSIFTPFLLAYVEHMCGTRMSQSTCMETQMIIPPYDEQIEIVKTMRNIYQHVDIQGVDGTVFRLLLNHDVDKLNELLGLVQQVNALRSEVAAIIEDTN